MGYFLERTTVSALFIVRFENERVVYDMRAQIMVVVLSSRTSCCHRAESVLDVHKLKDVHNFASRDKFFVSVDDYNE